MRNFHVVVSLYAQGDQVYKSVFLIFFQGEQLKTRVKKICEGYAHLSQSLPHRCLSPITEPRGPLQSLDWVQRCERSIFDCAQ